MNEVNEEGKGKGCACVHFDALECSRLRYGSIDRFDWNDIDDACECLCHKWEREEDEKRADEMRKQQKQRG